MKKKTDTSRMPGFLSRVSSSSRDQQRIMLLLLAFYLIILSLAVSFNHLGDMYSKAALSIYEPGKVADRDLILDQDISYVDEQATAAKRAAELALVYPVYEIDERLTQRVTESIAGFIAVAESLKEESLTPKEFFLQLQRRFPQVFSEEDAAKLFPYLQRGFRPSMEILNAIQNYGVISPPDDPEIEFIDIWRWQSGVRVHEVVHVDQLYKPGRVREVAADIAINMGFTRSYSEALALVCDRFKRENGFLNQDRTRMARDRAVREVEPVLVRLTRGDAVIRKGFLVTESDMKHLAAISSFSFTLNIYGILGTSLILLCFLILGTRLISPPLIERRLGLTEQYFCIGLAFLYVLMLFLLQRFVISSEYYFGALFLPTSLIAMLAAILIRPRVGIMLVLALSLVHLILDTHPVLSMLFAFLSGIIGTFLVINVKKRLSLVQATFILAMCGAALMLLLGIYGQFPPGPLFVAAAIAGLNGFFCGILNLGLLPFFEHMMNVPTPFRLMELSDLNTPLFRRMITLAPGTYGHSVAVANLAESAARDIGANALLARVGAYYHDIGKIDQAEYFIENQSGIDNKHDDLKPSLSAAVIKSHVKVGIEKARELALPQAVIDIIEQHHGNGVINYFYSEAIKEAGDDERINQKDFSYNGHPPQSREAAVVMLADTVEAATRSLKNPTIAKLEKFIWKQIMDRFTSGQLNFCDLTLRDLEKIRNTFVQILAGHFHSRIEYPEQNDTRKQVRNEHYRNKL